MPILVSMGRAALIRLRAARRKTRQLLERKDFPVSKFHILFLDVD